eukprot:1265951-Amphidinium_carterae.1
MQPPPIMEKAMVSSSLEDDIQTLLALPLPRSRLQKLDDGSRSENRSALLGAYSRQGAGVTRHTSQQRYVEAQAACHRIAALRTCTRLPYSSININEGAFATHTDLNLGPSVVFAFGSYTEGDLRLSVGDRWLSLHGDRQFILFDGSKEHEVCRYRGVRRSITFFVTRAPHRLGESDWGALRKWGFPVDLCNCFKVYIGLLLECPDRGLVQGEVASRVTPMHVAAPPSPDLHQKESGETRQKTERKRGTKRAILFPREVWTMRFLKCMMA